MRISPRLVTGLLAILAGVPAAVAADPTPPAASRAEFRIGGGSVRDSVAQMASLLQLTVAQQAKVKALMEQRAEALRGTMTAALQAYRKGLESVPLTSSQLRTLRQPNSYGAVLGQLAADLGLTATQKREVKVLMDQRSKSVGAAAKEDQAAYAAGLQSVLTASESATLADLESHSQGLSIPIGK